MCKGTCGGGFHAQCKSWGLLALRLVVGVIFIYLGYGHAVSNHAGAALMMGGKVGLPGGGSLWAYLVGTLEIVGGVMVLLGAWVRYAAVWLGFIVLVAMGTVHRGGPFMGYFLPLSMLGSCLALIGTGAGKFRLIQNECCCKECKNKMAGSGCGGNCSCGMDKTDSKCSCQKCCNGNCTCRGGSGGCAHCLNK